MQGLRYAYWSHKRDRRIRCACEHRFSPDALLLDGIATVRCRVCSRTLVLVAIPGERMKLVAELEPGEMQSIASMRATEVAALLAGVVA